MEAEGQSKRNEEVMKALPDFILDAVSE